MAAVGRPTKFTRELGKACAALAREGKSRHAVAGLVGIAPQTLQNWLKGDAASITAEEHDEFLGIYAKAEAEYESERVSAVEAAPDWKAHAWIAERRWAHWRIPKDEQDDKRDQAPQVVVVQVPAGSNVTLPQAPSTEQSK